MGWFVQLVIAIVMLAVSYLIAPRPKSSSGPPATAQELDDPTADAGAPIPVVFGTITIKSPNVLWFGQKSIKTYSVDA